MPDLRVVICVPWRGGDESREAIWAQMRPWMERTGFEVFTGDSNPALPFNRAQARNDAAISAGDWDVACFVDADTYIPEEQLIEAIALAVETRGAVLPFTRFLSMHPITHETRERIATGGANFLISGDVVVHREAFEEVGGWDEAISGYGWEDGAFLKMMLGLRSLRLVEGTMVAYEHVRTEDEDPNIVIDRGRPPEADRYDTTPLADIATENAVSLAHARTLRAQSVPAREAAIISA